MRVLFGGVLLCGCPDGPECGGRLEPYCADHGCPTWQEVVDRWSANPYGDDLSVSRCSDGALLLVTIGYMTGTTFAYNADGELVSATNWSDLDEFCGEYSRTFGDRPECASSCDIDPASIGDTMPECP